MAAWPGVALPGAALLYWRARFELSEAERVVWALLFFMLTGILLTNLLVTHVSLRYQYWMIPLWLLLAIRGLGLRGLKLSPPTQEFFPHDRAKAYPIYEAAQDLGIPVVIHCGMSWEPKAKASWAQPLFLEDVACDFPKLNIVIAHMGWPWVLDSVMLALKYPNIHLDTAALYFDNPWDFIAFMMSKQVPLTVFERSLRHQVVFGSNYPRVEIKNMVHAVKKLGLSEDCQHLIFQENGEKLIGERAA